MYCQVEQQKMLKLKEQSDSTIKKLNSEIQVTNEIFLFISCLDLLPVLLNYFIDPWLPFEMKNGAIPRLPGI